MIKIDWSIKDNAWAFANLAKHVKNEVSEMEHTENSPDGADVKISLTPHDFKEKEADKRTILHLDSRRWYEQFKND